jgi:hypothetical protein
VKSIKLINERGYVLVAGLENAPDCSNVKSFDIKSNGEKDITITLFQDETGTKAGEMVKKGYFQLGKIFEMDTLCVSFPSKDQIHVRIATKKEIDESNKQNNEKKTSAKKSSVGKAEKKTSSIEKMLAEGVIKQGEKVGMYEFTQPTDVNENDKITCLRKSGTFTVKKIDHEKGIISAEDSNKQHHYFGLREVAIAK